MNPQQDTLEIITDEVHRSAGTLARSISTLPLRGPRNPGSESEGRPTQNMRAYELMIIIDGSLDEPAAQKWVDTITKGVKAAGGTVHGRADWWGKRRLAYPIKKKEDGYYVVFNLVAPGGSLDELERSFRIADDVLRHKLLRLPEAEAARRGLVAA